MIFDSVSIETLRSKYSDQSCDLLVPGILQIDRREELAVERATLEQMILLVPERWRPAHLRELLHERMGEHLGAWFHLMLCRWLLDLGAGKILVEPEVLGDNVDLFMTSGSLGIAIEATSALGNAIRNPREDTQNGILCTLYDLSRPYVIQGSIQNAAKTIDLDDFRHCLEIWTAISPDEPFVYEDTRGNRVSLRATPSDRPRIMVSLMAFSIRPELVEKQLRRKAKQHPRIRRSGMPYVIAIFLPYKGFSSDEVKSAWKKIQEPTVTGILVLKSRYEPSMGTRVLDGQYMQLADTDDPLGRIFFPDRT